MAELLLGLDIGTSGVKVGVVAPDGRLLGLGWSREGKRAICLRGRGLGGLPGEHPAKSLPGPLRCHAELGADLPGEARQTEHCLHEGGLCGDHQGKQHGHRGHEVGARRGEQGHQQLAEDFTPFSAGREAMDHVAGEQQMKKYCAAHRGAEVCECVARGLVACQEHDLTAAAEPTSNAVIITASAKNLAKVKALIAQLDAETTGGRKIEFIILQNAKATDVAKVLSQAVGRARGRRGRGPAEEPPTISADAAANAVVIAGKKGDLETLMALAKQLDQASVGRTTTVQMLPLKNADAVEVAAMVSRLQRDTYLAARRAGKTVEPVAVSADERSNALVVAGTEEGIRQVSKLINQIDEMSPPKANLKLIQLKNADPNDVLQAIERIFGSGANGRVGRPAARGGGRRPTPRRGGGKAGAPEVTALAGQKALLVNASEEDWKIIQQIVEALDAAAEKVRPEVMVFPLAKAPNTRVAQALNSMYRAAMRRGREEDRVTVTPLAGTNAVVVTAAREKMQEVAKLIQQLDGADAMVSFRVG